MAVISTKELAGLQVVDARKQKRIGKVRYFIFHPTQNRVVGFTVKRRDALLMFKRKDMFVQLHGFDVENGNLVVRESETATDEGACKALGIDWEECVLWIGMPVMTESGDMLGYIDDALFDPHTGDIESISVETGKTKDALLGRRVLPVKHIEGFRRGQGIALAPMGEYDGGDDESETQRGAIVVDHEALALMRTGGVAEAAGKASAVIADKARKSVVRVKKGAVEAKSKADAAYTEAKPEVRKAAATAEEAINKGAYAAGEHVARIGGMFAAFKEEFDKGMAGEYDDEDN